MESGINLGQKEIEKAIIINPYGGKDNNSADPTGVINN